MSVLQKKEGSMHKSNRLSINSENTACPLCEEDGEHLQVHAQLRYSYPAKICQCRSCSFVFLSPRPTPEALRSYYQGEYRVEYEDGDVESRFLTDLPEATLRLQRVKEIVNCSASTLLEMGSGSGAFLSLAHETFSSATGLELDANSCQAMRKKGLKVHHDLDDLGANKYDVIVAFHVLEHFVDPTLFLKDISHYLAEGGCVIVEVPNIDDVLISLYNIEEFKDFYFCFAHLSYFSPETLTKCAAQAGLIGEVSQVQRYDLNNHLHWLMYKKPGTLTGEQNILSQATLHSYEQDLRSNNRGDTLWGVFRKPKL